MAALPASRSLVRAKEKIEVMQRAYAYPPDLARYVEASWPSGRALPVSSRLFAEALAVAHQASMTSEEGRPTRFRLLLTPPGELPEQGAPNAGALRLRFDRSRPLHEDELRRLSPATPFETALIAAHVEDEKLRIWGIAHSGPAWLAPTWGGRSVVPNWTYDPIIHVTAPGQMAVRCAGKLIGGLERGVLIDTVLDVFESEWLPAMFADARDLVRTELAARYPQLVSASAIEHSLVSRVSQHMVRRATQLVRGARHGGMILVVDKADDIAGDDVDGLRLKYRFQQDEPAHRYQTLLARIVEAISASTDKASFGWADFAGDESARFEELERAVFEHSRLIANLTAIDGAVVLDKRFSLLGFGAEVSAELPTPSRIWRAIDTEGTRRELDDLENVGTRHRAAYRFVNDHPEGLAIVISHDGGVSFVAKRNGEVVFWKQSVSP